MAAQTERLLIGGRFFHWLDIEVRRRVTTNFAALDELSFIAFGFV